jgi:hypothetical protein
MDEAVIRELTRRIIKREGIPNRPPDQIWGGYGTGLPCAICDLPVRKDEMEFELEFVVDSAELCVAVYHLHNGCFTVWESERNMREQN